MTVIDIEEMDDAGGLEIPDEAGSVDYRSDWKIFIPTFLILLSYGLCMAYLWATQRSDGALFRLSALVAGIGVPLLAAHAFLRLETICVRLLPDAVQFHRGWPKNNATVIPNELITGMKVKRGLIGRILGGGTLIIRTKGGGKNVVGDLRDPDQLINQYDLQKS